MRTSWTSAPRIGDGGGARVLVLGDRLGVALPASRALARAGHVVGVAVSSRRAPVLSSRAVAHRHLFPDRAAPQAAWTAALDDAVRERGYDAVLACDDVDMARLLAARPSVAAVPSIVGRGAVILDKAALAGLCAAAAVRYPRTWLAGTPHDDATIAASVTRPAVVKAAVPATVTDDGVVHVHAVAEIEDPRDLPAAIQRYRAAGVRPIVQERVDGPGLQAAIIRRLGVTSCRLVARLELATPAEGTLRQLDSSAGVGGECVAALERAADAVGFEGLLQAEFILPVSGPPCLIDLNPRLWGGLSFAELVGLRMTERVVRDALGLPPPPMPPEVIGRGYHHVARELTHLARSPRDLPLVLARWHRGDVRDAPRWNDLAPHLVQAREAWRRVSRA